MDISQVMFGILASLTAADKAAVISIAMSTEGLTVFVRSGKGVNLSSSISIQQLGNADVDSAGELIKQSLGQLRLINSMQGKGLALADAQINGKAGHE